MCNCTAHFFLSFFSLSILLVNSLNKPKQSMLSLLFNLNCMQLSLVRNEMFNFIRWINQIAERWERRRKKRKSELQTYNEHHKHSLFVISIECWSQQFFSTKNNDWVIIINFHYKFFLFIYHCDHNVWCLIAYQMPWINVFFVVFLIQYFESTAFTCYD